MPHAHTHGAYLPEHHSKRPDVRLGGEVAVEESLDGHPPQGQWPVGRGDVDLVRWEESRHAKVRDLERLALPHQDVAAGQVTMHYPQTGEVLLC